MQKKSLNQQCATRIVDSLEHLPANSQRFVGFTVAFVSFFFNLLSMRLKYLHLLLLVPVFLLASTGPLRARAPHLLTSMAIAKTTVDQSKRFHVFFSGRVQGVGFRNSVRSHAIELGLRGWVKNLVDARVEMLAEGPEPIFKLLLGKLRESFQIHKIDIQLEPVANSLNGFKILK
jgi:acylphosphatase